MDKVCFIFNCYNNFMSRVISAVALDAVMYSPSAEANATQFNLFLIYDKTLFPNLNNFSSVDFR